MAPFFVYPTLSLPRRNKTPQNASRRVTDADSNLCGVYDCDYLAESLEDNACGRGRAGVCARVCAWVPALSPVHHVEYRFSFPGTPCWVSILILRRAFTVLTCQPSLC